MPQTTMLQFGSHEMSAPLERVLMAAPSDAMFNADTAKWHYSKPIDVAGVTEDFRQLELLLLKAGVIVDRLPAERGELADSVFTHDASIVTQYGAVLFNMGKPLRRGEELLHRAYYEQLGVPILGEITAPGTMEGGDSVWLDDKTLAVGMGYRTNMAAVEQLREMFAPHGMQVLAYDLPVLGGPEACLHLMSVISPLAADLMLVHYPLLPVRLVQEMEQRGIQLVVTPEAEFAASVGINTNVLALGPRDVIMVAGFPQTKAVLEAAGCRVQTFQGEHLCMVAEGGPTCMTRPVWRTS